MLHPVPEKAPRAILYLRQSTFREESISLELQENAGRDYCDRMGYVVVGVEQDPGISGRTWKRPAVQRVMSAVENHAADVIVLWRWSRLSRSRKDWALAADRVDVAGGRIESATEPNDVTAAGRFARGVMTELAAFESERIGEQWKEVHQSRVSKGKPSGRTPWGWVRENGTVKPHPVNAAVIPRLYDMYIQGAGGRSLAAWLQRNGYRTMYGGAWNDQTVTNMLDSPFHTGHIIYHGELHEGEHEPLVPDAIYQQYMALRAERKSERAGRHRYLLSGMIKCSCGGTMFGFANHRSKRGAYFGYRCDNISGNPTHGPGTVSTRIIDPVLLEWLSDLSMEGAPPPIVDAPKLDAQRLSREITDIDRQVISLTEQLGRGLVPERAYRTTVEALEARRAALSATLTTVEAQIVLAPVNPSKDARSLLAVWVTEPLPAKRAALRALILNMSIDYGPPRTLTITPRIGTPVTKQI